MSARTEQRAFADTLRSLIDGTVLTAGDAGYDPARTPFFSHRIGYPKAVVRPKHAADVAAAVDFANRTGTALSVRSGGHSWYSTGGGLLLDLGSLTALEPDRSRGSAWAETGLTANDVTQALAPHGLAVGFGIPEVSASVASPWVEGGFLSRLHGMTIDNVLAVPTTPTKSRPPTRAKRSRSCDASKRRTTRQTCSVTT
jgi:FAD/FMN-containing dehydrogenase